MSLKRKFAEWMRKWADRIGPEDAFCATGIKFYYRNRIGMVIDPGDGGVHPEKPGDIGVRLWYRRSDYDERRFGDPEVARTLTAFDELVKEANQE